MTDESRRATPPAPSSDKPLMRDDAVGEVAWMLRHVESGEILNGVWASRSEAEKDAPFLGVSGEIKALPVYDHAPQFAEEYTALDAWQELVEFDDRTSPAEHPDMALITFEELKQFMSAAHWERTTPTPVEEPEAGGSVAARVWSRIGERYFASYERALNDPLLAGYEPRECPSELLFDLLERYRALSATNTGQANAAPSSGQAGIIDALRMVVGDEIGNQTEARERFLEEAHELAQASGGSLEEAIWSARQVFAKAIDPVALEVGQVSTALHRLAYAHGVSVAKEAEADRLHIVANAGDIRERHARKVRFAASSGEAVETISRILCRQDGYDPDGAGRNGYSWLNYEQKAQQVIAALASPSISEEKVEAAARAHCDFFGGEGWWDTGLIADTKPKAIEAMRAALTASSLSEQSA